MFKWRRRRDHEVSLAPERRTQISADYGFSALRPAPRVREDRDSLDTYPLLVHLPDGSTRVMHSQGLPEEGLYLDVVEGPDDWVVESVDEAFSRRDVVFEVTVRTGLTSL